MKMSYSRKALALILCFILAFSTFTGNVFAANEDADLDMGEDVIITTLADVYVSANGSDSNAGTEAAPFATLAKALVRVADGGTIHIVDTVTVPTGMSWIDRNVTPVTITGGTLDLSAGDFVIGYDVIFDSITLKGTTNIYANGNNVTVNSTVTTSGTVNIYGGGNSGEALESTNLTILGGTFATVYGGGSSGVITDSTNLYIGGGTITTVFGGSNGFNHRGNVNVVIAGGTINSLFGGSTGASLTGNVTVHITDGTITRRIFGGCNNEYTYKSGLGTIGASISWNTSYYVNGKVDVIIGEGANITTDSSSESDKAFFAHSRYKTPNTNEDSSIIFTSQTAYDNNDSKFGTKENAASIGTANNLNGAGMGTDYTGAADNIHIHGITTDDTADTITEGCKTVDDAVDPDPCVSSVATLSIDPKASLVYTGEEIAPAVVTVEGSLLFGEPTVTYENNVNAGTATAIMSYNGVSVSKEFTIEKASQRAPKGLVSIPESISGIADGEIYGLTTAMEYSTDGATYTPVTNVNVALASGTYYVRFAETDNYSPSDSTEVIIQEGKKLVVTFVADGTTVTTKEVSYGATLTDIPEVPAKTGYDKTAPVWDVTDFSNITSDFTTNAVYTLNTYTVTYIVDGVAVSTQTINHGENAVAPQIPAKDGYTLVAPYWNGEATNVTDDITITAVYVKDFIPGDIDGDSRVNLNDLITLAQYVAGWDNVEVNRYALDVNGDGKADLQDVTVLSRYLALWDGVTLSSEPYMG